MFGEENKEKTAIEKLNEIAMELQENEENMAFMDEYAQKFYKMAKEDEKAFRKSVKKRKKRIENVCDL